MDNPENLSKYDSALLGILQHEGQLEPFLDVVFRFLFRKTDFYHVMTDTQQKYGFPEGVAEKLIKKCFNKYSTLTKKMVDAADKNTQNLQNASKSKVKDLPDATDTNTKNLPDSSSSKPPSDSKVQKQVSSNKRPTDSVPKSSVLAQRSDEASSQISEIPKLQEEFQQNPDSYNGAVRDRYSWSQNYDDIDVNIPVAKSITKGRQVKVTIERQHLFVSIVNESGQMDTIIDGDLKHGIMREDSMWSLESGKSIQITLTKDTKYWWNALLTNEEEIDIQKITPERPMTDMQEDEIAVINKLQFDEKQKRLGLPQSHELKVHDMLKKGWDAEGSPFKGQEFDPKMFNISPSGVQ